MSAPSGLQEALPQIRTNKHFRIKSASREKILLGGELLTTRGKRKSSTDDAKRIFSEHKSRKSGSIDSNIKIRISREQLNARFEKRPSKKIAYEAVKTDVDPPEDSPPPFHLHTVTHQLSLKQAQLRVEPLPKLADKRQHKEKGTAQKQKIVTQKQKGTNQKQRGMSEKQRGTSEKQKQKQRTGEKWQQKGKYRCRVNQYIFDHSRKKSNHCSKQQQEAIDAFWNNVNESMILGGGQAEEMSKDLREFVEHFQTE